MQAEHNPGQNNTPVSVSWLMKLSDINNFRRVSETIASSGQPDELAFRDIAKAGYALIINLSMPNSENAIPEEGNIVTARKMTYVHIPVPFDAPTPEHLATFFRVMEAFEGKKIWVHCVVNKRASAFLYQLLRLTQGVPIEQAREVIVSGWEPDPAWRCLMELDADDLGA